MEQNVLLLVTFVTSSLISTLLSYYKYICTLRNSIVLGLISGVDFVLFYRFLEGRVQVNSQLSLSIIMSLLVLAIIKRVIPVMFSRRV